MGSGMNTSKTQTTQTQMESGLGSNKIPDYQGIAACTRSSSYLAWARHATLVVWALWLCCFVVASLTGKPGCKNNDATGFAESLATRVS